MYPCSAGVQIEHEVGQHSLQPRAQIPIDRKSRSCQFDGALKVQHSQFFADFPVRLRDEIEFGWRSPATNFDIIFRGTANRNARDAAGWECRPEPCEGAGRILPRPFAVAEFLRENSWFLR